MQSRIQKRKKNHAEIKHFFQYQKRTKTKEKLLMRK